MDNYNRLFDKFSKNGHSIPGAQLKDFFMQTGLTTQQLGEIWDMSDIDRDGCLDRAEFVSACSLVKAVCEKLGKPLDLLSLKYDNISADSKGQKPSSTTSSMWDTFADLISSDDVEKRWTEIFKAADTCATGFLTGEQAKPLLASSRLPRPVLARIWNEVDPSGTGKLSLAQFISAMRACEQLKEKDTRRPSISESTRKSLEARRQMEMRVQEEYAISQRRVINERLSDAKRDQESLKASVQAAQYEGVSLDDKVSQCRTKLNSLTTENEQSQVRITQLQQQCAAIDVDFDKMNQRYKELNEQYKNMVKMSKDMDKAIIELEERKRQADNQFNSEDDTLLQEMSKSLELLVAEESQLRQRLIDTRVKLENIETSAMALENQVMDKWVEMDEAEEAFVKLVNKAMEESNNHSDEFLTIFKMASELIDIDLSSIRPKRPSNNDPFQGHDPFEESVDSGEWICEKEERLSYGKKNCAPPLPVNVTKLYPDLESIAPHESANLFPDISLITSIDHKAQLPSMVRAIKSYHTVKRPNHLNFDIGDIIQVRSEQDEWYSGQLNGKIGWLPKSYVEAIDDTPSEQAKANRLCRALYDFQSDIAGDLRFSKNDIIVIDDDTKAWWTGHIGSRCGNFPSNYVETVKLTNSLPDISKGEYMVKALFHYSPEADHQKNDLTFKRGDLIKILGSAGESWLYGQIADKCGMLPANYVQII